MEISDQQHPMLMNSDIQNIEEILTELEPQPLSADLLARLDHAMSQADEIEESPDISSEEELDISLKLSELDPCPISSELILRLDHAMSRWHESVPLEEKVVALNQEQVNKPSSSHWLGWKSAAAVAILGVSMAFLTGERPEAHSPDIVRNEAIMLSPSEKNIVGTSVQDPNIRPASYTFRPRHSQADFVGATERGLLRTQDGQVLRCVELKVNNKFKFKNARGETITVQAPRTQLFLSPLTVD